MSAPAPSWRSRRPRQACEAIWRAAAAYRIAPQRVLRGSQDAVSVQARRQAIGELRGFGYSLSRIGRVLGGFHHTTILHHLQKGVLPPPELFDASVPDESGIWA